MENKQKHLEFIEAVINRMATTSFLIKGWSVTLAVVLLSVIVKNHNVFSDLAAFLISFPIILLWSLDGYFLYQEKLFRDLYNEVRTMEDVRINFLMDTDQFKNKKNTLLKTTFCSRILLIFYLPLFFIMLIMIYLLLTY